MPPDADQPTGPGADTAPPRLLLATTNPHKIAEFRALLAGAPYALVDPAVLGLDLDVSETGATFAENATIKALAWANAARLLTLADDSGLEIDALDGWPGLHSARWIGPDVPYSDRNRIILERMANVPLERRTARYRCAIAVADVVASDAGAEARIIVAVEGTVEGYIAQAPSGSGGFGYDPIFEVPAEGRTFGEMSGAEKDQISHRARAARAAMAELRRIRAAEA
jgi:XTP/dITP diphosphohydrolase